MRNVQRSILDARRWLCLFMVCCFIICGIGGIYQRAQALVAVDDAVIAILIASLGAIGISFVTHGAYNSLSDFVSELIDEWAGTQGSSFEELLSGSQYAVNSAGQILMNNRFLQLVSTFASWLKAKWNLQDNTTINVVASGASLDDLTLYQLPLVIQAGTNDYYKYTLISGDGYATIYQSDSNPNLYLIMGISESQGTIMAVQRFYNNGDPIGNASNKNISSLYNSGYYAGYLDSKAQSEMNRNNLAYSTEAQFYAALGGTGQIEESDVAIDLQVGTIALPSDNPDFVQGMYGILDVEAPWASSIGQITGIAIPAEWQLGSAGEGTMAYASPGDVVGQIDVAGSQSISVNPADYLTPGLKDVFPFCLPFDVYNFLSCLAADPVAPSFTWRFYVPRLCDETFTVDLSPFDTVAQIVRTMELLAFCIGLAYVTREKFIRG